MENKLKNKLKQIPQRLAIWLLSKTINPDILYEVLGDFEQLYEQKLMKNGYFSATLWLWLQIIYSFPKLLLDKIYWGVVMLKSYIKIAVRNIARQKIFSFINIFGLSFGLALFLLILLFVHYEFSFESHNPKADNIYRVIMEIRGHNHSGKTHMAVTPNPLAKVLAEEIPEIKSATRIARLSDIQIKYKTEQYFEEQIFFSDPSLINDFSINLIKGNKQDVLSSPNTVIISKKIAEKYFGKANPIGEIIKLEDEFDIKVTGVFEKIPSNSHLNLDFVFSMQALESLFKYDLTSWRGIGIASYTYIYVDEDVDFNLLSEKVNNVAGKHKKSFEEKYGGHNQSHGHNQHHSQNSELFQLQPLKDIHLYSDLYAEISANGDIKTVYIFSSIALFILLIASINYMNLSSARSIRRSLEVGLRKVVGAKRQQLIYQFVGESFIITCFALIVSIFITIILLPYFNELMGRNIELLFLFDGKVLYAILITLFLVSLIAGFYPAWLLSAFQPIKIFRDNLNKGSQKSVFRNAMVVLQFSVSIILIVSTLVITEQLEFIRHGDLGYSKDQILVLSVPDQDMLGKVETIKNELLKQKGILKVSTSKYLPNRISDMTRFKWNGMPEDADIRTYANQVDYDYLDLFNMKLVEGRNFSKEYVSDKSGAFLINETAQKALGWDKVIGKKIKHWTGKEGEIIGVIKDFNFHSLRQKIEPVMFLLDPGNDGYNISIKIQSGEIEPALASIEKIWKKFSNKYPFSYNFFDEIFDREYKADILLSEMFNYFSVLAIILSCLGLFGLAAFSAEQRTKEIGVRKVMGANSPDIIAMLIKEFIRWVVIANIIAWPIAYYLMKNWLEDFAFKIDITLDTFVISALMALFIAFGTIFWQAYKSARANPVDSLKYE